MATTAERSTGQAARRAVLVVNTHARSGESAYASAKQMLEEKGFSLDESYPVREPARLPEVVAQALAQGHSTIVVGGGDGTISAAANVLAGKDATLGILPLGTANSFARSLNLPLDLSEAVEVLAAGRSKQVDLGRINDACFVTTAAVGVSSEIQRRKPNILKRLLGRLAYPAVAGMVMPGFEPFTCTLTVDGGERRHFSAALEVRIANAPYGGGVDAAPEASVTSGDLVVHVVTGQSKWRLVKTWGKIIAGLEPDGPGFETLRTKSVRVETEPSVHVNVDGEAALETPIDVSIARKALRVIVR
jgi:YegS/Rv2252/BmrU family lipid kinase